MAASRSAAKNIGTGARRRITSALHKSAFVGPVVVVMAGAQTEDKLMKSLRESNVPDIVGVAEVANILKVSRRRVRSGIGPRSRATLSDGHAARAGRRRVLLAP